MALFVVNSYFDITICQRPECEHGSTSLADLSERVVRDALNRYEFGD